MKKELSYYRLIDGTSIIRKSYSDADDVRQCYLEVSEMLNFKLCYVLAKFQEIDISPLDAIKIIIKIGINKCESYTLMNLDFATFMHQEVLKDFDEVKDSLLIFDEN